MARAVTHNALVRHAEAWLRRAAHCDVVLTEQSAGDEVPDAIGWKDGCSIIVECKISRSDFFADSGKPWRGDAGSGMGLLRYFLVPHGLIAAAELPAGWGLLELGADGRICRRKRATRRAQRNSEGEIAFLAATLRRVSLRVGGENLTEWLKFRHRLVEYNGGITPGQVGVAGITELQEN